MTLPSDALKKPARRAPWIISGATALAILASAVAFGPAVASQLNPAPTATATALAADAPTGLTDAELAATQAGADAQQAQIAADAAAAAAAAAADAAAAQAAADAAAKAAVKKSTSGYAAGQAPAGTPIPMHLDTDPNSGSYGQQVIENPDQFCASNGGTTGSGGVAVCS